MELRVEYKYIYVGEEWLDKLFDISKCRCTISTPSQICKDNLRCKCSCDDGVPAAKVEFLLDQYSTRRMVLSSTRDMVHAKLRKHAFMRSKTVLNE